MDKVRVFYDREGQTLTVWFDDPRHEAVAEETGEEVILIKNAEANPSCEQAHRGTDGR